MTLKIKKDFPDYLQLFFSSKKLFDPRQIQKISSLKRFDAVILNGIRLSFDDAIEKLDLITKQVEQHYTYWLMHKNKLNEHQ